MDFDGVTSRLTSCFHSVMFCVEIIDSRSYRTEALSENEVNTKSSHRSRTCLVLRDISSMETEVHNDHVTWPSCADDVSVLDVIETCYGRRPILLSDRVVERRPNTSGKHLDSSNNDNNNNKQQ